MSSASPGGLLGASGFIQKRRRKEEDKEVGMEKDEEQCSDMAKRRHLDNGCTCTT